MLDASLQLLAVPLLPFIGAVLCVLFGSVKELRSWAHAPVVLCAALSFGCAWGVATNLSDTNQTVLFPTSTGPEAAIVWFSMDYEWSKIVVEFSLHADQLAGVMLLGVTFIGFWIVVFSIGYMKGSPGYPRYFAVVSLFLASMNILVLSSNFILLFAGWEGVGVCSYLLVGYWHHKNSAAAAARKAFLVTRLGDVGLILGILLLWSMTGNQGFEFDRVFFNVPGLAASYPVLFPLACVLILLGAVGKSAQFPLYVWLPDAMEGPTPVSALIHAATMVTAGVYLLARCSPLFLALPGLQVIVACIGAFTALLAAFIALTQNDLKRVLAYSTVSQIGFMFLAIGCAGPALPKLAVVAAIFHLFTHAFFKAVLFLSSGSVMHAMHDKIDMREFSGLRKVLPVTHVAFLCGALALAGVPLFSGFFSKDMILEAALEAGHSERFGTIYMILFGVALVTAMMTAFYTFRAYFKTFWGPLKMPEGAHPHETWIMNLPLAVLAVGALFVGITAEPFTQWFSRFLGHAEFLEKTPDPQHHLNWPLILGSSAVALAGIGIAFYMYMIKLAAAANVAKASGNAYSMSLNKLYVDEIYKVLFVQPMNLLAGICSLVDAIVSDLVRLIASIPRAIAELIKPMQNGLVQFYALAMVMGVTAFIGYLVLFAR